jgi:glyoxylase-like metal-dependent hydrolase (beta-lactamase superfamily II)
VKPGGFAPVAGSERVFRLEDGCAAYLLRDGERALLIDLGAGAALERLAGTGVRVLDGVLFTHAHRDQCAGAGRAAAAGIPLRFPVAARAVVDPDERADLRLPTPLLRAYPGRFLPPRPIPDARFDLRPGATLSWGSFDLEIVAAPGHIDHQVAFLVDDGPRRIAFCGDAIHSPGKVHEPYHLETDHYTGAGARVAAETLRALMQLRPNVFCPSHGPVTEGDPWPAFTGTIARLHRLAALKDTICPGRPAVPRLVRPTPGALMPLSAHLYVWNNSYFLLSEDGPALMVDNAGELPDSFWQQWQALPGGERPIEVVLVTHIHCDHVEGIEPLRAAQAAGRHMGPPLQAWAHAAIADCVEEPHRWRRPWLAEQGARVDRRLAEGEAFTWREYAFRAHDFPGQTDLHAAYETTVDGRRVLFSGDNFYPPQQWGGTGGLCGLNGGHPFKGWRRSIDLVLSLEPEWILASHIQPFPYRRDDFLACRDWTEAVAAAMRDIAPDGCLERHHDPHWITMEPYAQPAPPASGGYPAPTPVTVRLQNPYEHRVTAEVRLVLPEGWRVDDPERRIEIPAGGSSPAEWSITPQPSSRNELVTLDVTWDGEYLGEIAECYVRPAP